MIRKSEVISAVDTEDAKRAIEAYESLGYELIRITGMLSDEGYTAAWLHFRQPASKGRRACTECCGHSDTCERGI